ncbi:matrixin family metalloprotease [Acinetobacter sp. WZC-1]|uniref:matrixin family metalloprotease n=1 Tax=Acinetobacter sp. WZC-1 TaxID=3459034 RepID=UPI00403DD171
MRVWLILVLVLLAGYFALQRTLHPQLKHNTVMDQIQHPLDSRLRYRIGEVDPRFNISEPQLQLLAQQAADIWQQGAMQSLFVYDPDARLSINLIYDERQAESSARKHEIRILEHTRQYADSEQQKVKQLQQQLIQAKHELDLRQTGYQDKIEQYNQVVATINQSQQQFTDAVLQQLNLQKQQLHQEQYALQQQIDFFNGQVQQLNRQVDSLNTVNQQFNQSIDQFNTRFQPRQFDKGIFNGKQINIYEFDSHDDLRLTIAHELGHALGLAHNHDPHALMYPVMKDQDIQNFRLTEADLELLHHR